MAETHTDRFRAALRHALCYSMESSAKNEVEEVLRELQYMVVISKDEYRDMTNQINWLICLENAGVDNWQGFDFAREEFEETFGDEEEESP